MPLVSYCNDIAPKNYDLPKTMQTTINNNKMLRSNAHNETLCGKDMCL